MKQLLLSKFISMKNFILIPLIACCLFGFKANAQEEPEQLNLPGDNLNLYAVMKLFQESPTLEEFEKKLNDPDNKVNNLDLDGDNNIDYIKVADNVEGDIHNITLKVDVNKDEDQDVAVFVVKKDNDGQVQMQLIGDEDLYGKDYIIEPDSVAPGYTPNPAYNGTPVPVESQPEVYQVSSWPVISFIFVPTYVVWRSPWRWGYYPSYWHPWRPFFWHEYYGYHYHWNYYYRTHYRYTPVYRFPAWRDRYYGGGFRSRAPIVQVRIRGGNYRQTYTRPELANRGSDLFRRDHPQAPSVNRRLPPFDANNNNRPIVRPRDRDINRPGNDNRPGTRPGDYSPNRPGNGNRPGDNLPNRPITRPANPSPDASNRPITRPIERPHEVRPVTPIPDRPATRPVNPSPNPSTNRPITRPVERPRESRPVNPTPDRTNPGSRPVTRPVTPRPQQQVRPAPVPRPSRPTGERPPGRKKDEN